jgi:hypothetical protein
MIGGQLSSTAPRSYLLSIVYFHVRPCSSSSHKSFSLSLTPSFSTTFHVLHHLAQELNLPDFDELKEVYDDISHHVMVTAGRRLDRSNQKANSSALGKKDSQELSGMGADGGNAATPTKGKGPGMVVENAQEIGEDGGANSGANRRPVRASTHTILNVADKGKVLRGSLLTGLKRQTTDRGIQRQDSDDIFGKIADSSRSITRMQSKGKLPIDRKGSRASIASSASSSRAGSVAGATPTPPNDPAELARVPTATTTSHTDTTTISHSDRSEHRGEQPRSDSFGRGSRVAPESTAASVTATPASAGAGAPGPPLGGVSS